MTSRFFNSGFSFFRGVKFKTLFQQPTKSVNSPLFLSRSNSTYPNLRVLNTSLKHALAQKKSISLVNTAVVYVHHALFSSLPVLRAMFQLGLNPKNTFVLGKSYSECEEVVKQAIEMNVHYQPCSPQVGLGNFTHSFIQDINSLWQKVILSLQDNKEIENLIVMDHGGYALAFIPPEILRSGKKVIGIEKTTAGLINPYTRGIENHFPVIVPARCAAKIMLESRLIADAAVAKLLPLLPLKDKTITCGVLGYGAVGKAIADKLLSMGFKVLVYDSDNEKLKQVTGGAISTKNLPVILAYSQLLFGCTGNISVPSVENLKLSGNKVCISVSSADTEFLKILQGIQNSPNSKIATDPFANVVYTNEMGEEVTVIGGGFPGNFDKTGESVPAKDIDLTRSLVFMSVLQAVRFLQMPDVLAKGGIYMLDPELQKIVATEWLKEQTDFRFPPVIKKLFEDVKTIRELSEGNYEQIDIDVTSEMPRLKF